MISITHIEYLDIDLELYLAKFRVSGLYRDEAIDEVVCLDIKNIRINEVSEIEINSTLSFLQAVQDIKENLREKRVKNTLINIAYDKHIEHKKEIEELLLTLELKKKKTKRNIETITYDRKGNLSKLY